MNHLSILIGTFTTLVAVVNPFEALPIFLTLSMNMDKPARRKLAFRSCFYALLLIIAFIILGNLILKVFGVDLSMVRTVGGIILVKIGFDLFMPGKNGGIMDVSPANGNSNPAFIPLAMPIMFGPGVLATVLGMTSLKSPGQETLSIMMISIASVACMTLIFLMLAYADGLVKRLGKNGIDAATRIVGFFVAAMGIGLIFQGVGEFLKSYLH
jgi:multiple antibiotic resistance protein